MSTFSLPLVKGVNAKGRLRTHDLSQTPQCGNLVHWIALFLLVKGVEETKKVLVKVLKVVPWLCRVSQEGKGVSIVRKMKEKIKGYVSRIILCFGKNRIHEFAQEAEISHTKPIRKQEENRRWFKVCKVCLMLFLVFTKTGPRGVRSEDIGNPLISGSTAMYSIPANKNLRGPELSERRRMLGTEVASMNDNINYHNFPRGKSSPNNQVGKQANPYQRPCNPGEYCRQGNKGKKN